MINQNKSNRGVPKRNEKKNELGCSRREKQKKKMVETS